ncbi:MAG: hypothetical protein HC813_00085 [Planctomycetes bacterium]|nr:hypothetical protein [Planctomycetota bacterium]
MGRYLRYASAGTQLCIVVTLFTLGGVWLDREVGTMQPLSRFSARCWVRWAG